MYQIKQPWYYEHLKKVLGFVGILPPDDTWHVFLSGSASSRFPQEYTWRASPIRTPLRRGT